MRDSVTPLEKSLRRDIDSSATVGPYKAELSAYLASAYSLSKANLLDRELVIARPTNQAPTIDKTVKGAAALSRALGVEVILYQPALTRPQRRALIEARQPFVTEGGDYYLPQLALSLSPADNNAPSRERTFSPSNQQVFLYLLYSEEDVIQSDRIQVDLGLSTGSISTSLSLLVRRGLIEYAVGGRTGRKKEYRVPDKARFYREGMALFGSAAREAVTVSVSAARKGWLQAGLTALAACSDLLPPEQPIYAISPSQAKMLGKVTDDSDETDASCTVHILRFDPRPFARDGRVDPVTMLLTIGESDERISIALRQALGGYEWYQG